ncbi:MAG: 50S ribosomal protein L6 [Planctomycetota bacterium]|nr:50S ribosomal protein L6 [Planctomycetota bacterium]MDA1112838.1 50S ribosomal protein L6 [Planctomycetota bacterium]
MSRIGNKEVTLPAGVTVTVKASSVEVKGSKGQLTFPLFPEVSVAVEGEIVKVSQTGAGSSKNAGALHGLVRANIANMVVGVTEGYSKGLEIQGTGWNAKPNGTGIEMQIGFCHTVICTPPEGVSVQCTNPTTLLVSGIDKQAVGQFAANIRRVRPPEPYKGKGIRYKDEFVRRKAGKSLT